MNYRNKQIVVYFCNSYGAVHDDAHRSAAQFIPRENMALSLKKEIFTFFKAQGSAVFATGCDYAMRLFLDKVMDVNYLYATFIGALTGGVVNVFVNYNFAFRGNTVRKGEVALRYFIMWAGSIFLNTAGTGFFKAIVHLRVYTAMLLTSFLVALCWNYMLQRSFVFKDFHTQGKNKEQEGSNRTK